MFVQKLNPLTGEADWVLVNEPGLGDEDDAAADLVATSSYLDMLTDSRRNAAYHAALRRVIPAQQQQRHHSRAAPGGGGHGGPTGQGGVRVLDIGTGTGLLAMMAARLLPPPPGEAGAAADAATAAAAPTPVGTETGGTAAAAAPPPPDAPPTAPVIACEVFPPMQNLARRVIASNGLADRIRVVNKRSDEIVVQEPAEAAAAAAAAAAKQASLTPAAAARAARVAAAAAAAAGGGPTGPDMCGRADVIVTEIFDSELLGEGMIPTMRHAVQHLLKEGGVVIPATSRVYGQLVQCPLMHQMTGLRSRGAATSPAAAAAATDPWAGAADRVLAALGELDAAARGSVFSSEDLYEVREMHVDLLYQHGEAARRRRATHGSAQTPEEPPPPPAQQPSDAVSAPPPLLPLSEPFLVFDFDWRKPPPPSGRREVIQVPVVRDGEAHAVLLWWQLGMTPPSQCQTGGVRGAGAAGGGGGGGGSGGGGGGGSGGEGELLLSTAPEWLGGRPEAGGDGGPLGGVEQRWRDHWKQCWVQLADDAVPVLRGDVLRLSLEHDDLNMRAKLRDPGPRRRGDTDAAATLTTAAAAAAEDSSAAATATAAAATDAAPSSASGAPSSSSPAAAAAAAVKAVDGAQSARERLAALRAEAEAEEEATSRQQLMPLLSWLGPLALLQLGDLERLRAFSGALESALREGVGAAGGSAAGSGGAEVVVVDGSLALGLLAGTHPGVASVTLLQEDNLSAQNWLRAAARRLWIPPTKIKSVRSETYFKRLRAAAGGGGGASAGAGAAAAAPGPLVLVSEPYFSEFEQLVPWAHLRFWRDYDVIRGSAAARGGRRLAAFPRRARLVAVAAALPELWRTRSALAVVEGLDLSAANNVLGVVGADAEAEGGRGSGGDRAPDEDDPDRDVWGDGDGDGDGDGSSDGGAGGGGGGGGRQQLPILPYAIWQAGGGYEELSGREEVLVLDCGGHLDDVEGAATLTATHGSTCHAIVLWLEYDLTLSGGGGAAEESSVGSLVVSTAPERDGGPTATVQGVYLLRQPVELTRGSRLHVAAQFDGLDADITVEVTALPPPPPPPPASD